MSTVVFGQHEFPLIQEKFEAARLKFYEKRFQRVLERVRVYNSSCRAGKFLWIWSWEDEKIPEPTNAFELNDWWHTNKKIYYESDRCTNIFDGFTFTLNLEIYSKELNIIENFLNIISGDILPERYEFDAGWFNIIANVK